MFRYGVVKASAPRCPRRPACCGAAAALRARPQHRREAGGDRDAFPRRRASRRTAGPRGPGGRAAAMAGVEAAGAAPDYEAAELYTRAFRVGGLGRRWRQQLGPPDLSLTAEDAAAAEADAAAAAELGCTAETAAELRAVCRWPRGRCRWRRRAGGRLETGRQRREPGLEPGLPPGLRGRLRAGPARRCATRGRAEAAGVLWGVFAAPAGSLRARLVLVQGRLPRGLGGRCCRSDPAWVPQERQNNKQLFK